MAIITGNNATLQAGVETTWGTAVAPTTVIDFTSEDLRYVNNLTESDQLNGKTTTDRMDIMGIKVEGGFEIVANPDNVGLLLSAALGNEAAAAQVDASTAYDHAFTPLAAGASTSLPKLTLVIDRIIAAFGYVSCKVDSFDINASAQDYVRMSFSVRGYDEQNDALEALSSSTKRPFQFVDGAVEIDTVSYADITSFSMSYANNLENDLYTLNGSNKMQEIEPQKRDITFSIDTLYSSATNATRNNDFKVGDTVDLQLTFTSTEEVEAGYPYTLTIEAPECYIVSADPTVSGPDRITQRMELRATEGASPAVTITLRDDQSSDYI